MTVHDISDTQTLRKGRDHSAYELAIEGLEFQPYHTSDPVPVGAQILASAGLRPAEAYSLVALLASGDFEDVALNEPFDLRTKGVERFIAFRTDRLFRLLADRSQILWGTPTITAEQLRLLLGARDDQSAYLDVPGGQDRLIPDDEPLDLTAPGVERVILGPRPRPGYDVTVIYNGMVKTVRTDKRQTVQTLLDAARAAFGSPGGDLALFSTAGAALHPSHTLAQAGVGPGSQLLLRPRIVQGG